MLTGAKKKLQSGLFFLIFACTLNLQAAKPADLTPAQTGKTIQNILKSHVKYKQITPALTKRIYLTYLEELDPAKSYFIDPDIHLWADPSEEDLKKWTDEFNANNFSEFEKIDQKFNEAIERRKLLDAELKGQTYPKKVDPKEFKDMKWVKTVDELKERLLKIRTLRHEAAMKLDADLRDKAIERIEKYQKKFEDDALSKDQNYRTKLRLTDILKAAAASLDAHTTYFTPEEAEQFVINVQSRLFGIGAQLRDDLNGLSIVKLIEGGPAAESKELKTKDRIIAVNGEPIVGMEIEDAVQLIRGPEGTPVVLTIIRTSGEGENKKEEKLDIKLKRSEVVIKESRYETAIEPYGDGVIAYLRLHSFYQDADHSSKDDLEKELNRLKKEYNVKAVILDVRSNAGGMLTQAVGVAGLFVTKGTIVSIKDENGKIQHLRELSGKPVWEGPLMVLINRASASASEIVAGSLQDYGRALIVGDDRSFGKGSFQTFTLNTTQNGPINHAGEYKVTNGLYYTVSGNTPQLNGVKSDIVVPGIFSQSDMGETFSKFPLEGDKIEPNFDDKLDDVPDSQREGIRLLYKFNLQPQLKTYEPYIEKLKKNSSLRLENNKDYVEFLKQVKKQEGEKEEEPDDSEEKTLQGDVQLRESFDIMRDLLFFMQQDKH